MGKERKGETDKTKHGKKSREGKKRAKGKERKGRENT